MESQGRENIKEKSLPGKEPITWAKGLGTGALWLVRESRWLEGSGRKGPRREILQNCVCVGGLSRACRALWILTLPETEAIAEC